MNFILVSLFCIHLKLSFSHMLTFVHYIKLYFVFLDFARCKEVVRLIEVKSWFHCIIIIKHYLHSGL